MEAILTRLCTRKIGYVYRSVISGIGVSRSLAMDGKTDHLQRTADNFRAQMECAATVDEITDISPTVRKLTLKVQDDKFHFKAGQWVDFSIPGLETVGGFSMSSSPHKLKNHGLLDLAVKFSTHPPAYWVHTKCKPGASVQLRIGGDFHYDPVVSRSRDLLLIAGGVGINPMLSIIKCFAEDGDTSATSLLLLYSASSSEELLFQDEIEEICKQKENVNAKFFITKDQKSTTENSHIPINYSRIDTPVLASVLSTVYTDRTNVLCYICGPGSMTDDLEQKLIGLNIDKQQIIYEKWW